MYSKKKTNKFERNVIGFAAQKGFAGFVFLLSN